MVALNVIGIDATCVRISLLNPNHFLVSRWAKNTTFILGFLVIQKILLIWLLAGNVVCNMWDLPLQILELGFVTVRTNPLRL